MTIFFKKKIYKLEFKNCIRKQLFRAIRKNLEDLKVIYINTQIHQNIIDKI